MGQAGVSDKVGAGDKKPSEAVQRTKRPRPSELLKNNKNSSSGTKERFFLFRAGKKKCTKRALSPSMHHTGAIKDPP